MIHQLYLKAQGVALRHGDGAPPTAPVMLLFAGASLLFLSPRRFAPPRTRLNSQQPTLAVMVGSLSIYISVRHPCAPATAPRRGTAITTPSLHHGITSIHVSSRYVYNANERSTLCLLHRVRPARLACLVVVPAIEVRAPRTQAMPPPLLAGCGLSRRRATAPPWPYVAVRRCRWKWNRVSKRARAGHRR